MERAVRVARGCPLLVLLGACAPLPAGEFAPFQVRNQSPFVAIHGLPAIGFPTTLENGVSQIDMALDLTSNFTDAELESEAIVIDGETYRKLLRSEEQRDRARRYGLT